MRKLTAAQKRAERRRAADWEFTFVNGRQKRVRRPPTIDGLVVGEFVRRNAGPLWYHQQGMWEEMRGAWAD